MSNRLVMQYPDEQNAKDFQYVCTIYSPDGIRAIACTKLGYSENTNCLVAFDGETVVAMWNNSTPFVLVKQELYKRKSDVDLAEEELERYQAASVYQKRWNKLKENMDEGKRYE